VLADFIKKEIKLTPKSIIERLKLRNPIYQPTSSYGHFGRKFQKNAKVKIVVGEENGKAKTIDKVVDLFTWEELSLVPMFKKLLK